MDIYGACDVLENIKVTQKIRFNDIERYSVFVGDFSDYQQLQIVILNLCQFRHHEVCIAFNYKVVNIFYVK